MRSTPPTARSRQRGAVLATVGIFMIVLAGMGVLGVDVARLAFTATETQVVADAGAVAYAKTMLNNEVYDTNDSPFVAADGVVADNSIDGKSATNAQVDYAVGRFDFESRQFRPGGAPSNAVRALTTATVDNIFAGVFGDQSSKVKRLAVAAFGGAGEARPTLPIAIGDCFFSQYERSDSCSDLPKLKQMPQNDQNSCWTSLRPTRANADEVASLLPAECGGGATQPMVRVGEEINIMNGTSSSILHLLASCVGQGIRDFVIPIVECGQCNQLAPVIGFASVRVTNVKPAGKGKGLDLEALCRAESEGGAPGAGGNYGVKTLALVE